MSPVLLLTAAALGPWLANAPPPRPGPDPTITVTVDSARREVILRAGPFTIPAMAPGTDHSAHGSHDMEGMETPFLAFEWPVTGWLRGFRISLTDRQGRPLPRRLIHHVNMMHLDRRALLFEAVERTLAAGQETEDVSLPVGIGFPMPAGAATGLVAAWAHEGEAPIEDAILTVVLQWSPANLSPRPLDVLPLYLDVNYRGAGLSVSYDLPPGPSTRSWEFTLPIGGRLLAVGGHLHDFGGELVLEELPSRRAVTRLRARLDPAGRLQGVERRLFGVRGDGIRLHAGRRYRLTATYNNRTGQTIPAGGMGIMIGLFAPDDLRAWPAVDRNHPALQADIAAITGSAGAGHRH